jgi:hypothetical protein
MPLALKQIVDQASGISQVLAKVANAGADRFHDDEAIHPARRLDDAGHHRLVKAPHDTVKRFDGIRNGLGKNHHLRKL